MYVGSLPRASTSADYIETFQLLDDETGEGIDISGATVTLEVKKPERDAALLTASTDNGKIALDASQAGLFQLTFGVCEMRNLCPMTYDVGITIEINGEVTQYLVGTIPVVDGIVS
jgi:hypothetical protein